MFDFDFSPHTDFTLFFVAFYLIRADDASVWGGMHTLIKS